MNGRSTFFLGCLILAFGLLLGVAMPRTIQSGSPWYVATDGDDGNDCLNPVTACASINAAIETAANGDTIYVATGTYTGEGNAVVTTKEDVTISGGWDSTFSLQSGYSTLDGQSARRLVSIEFSPTVVLERLALINGSSHSGGGLEIQNGIVTVKESIIKSNYGRSQGGGIFVYDGIITLIETVVSANSAHDGGGIYTKRGELNLFDSTVDYNLGGGITSCCSTTLVNSTVSDNRKEGSGAGLYGFNMTLLSSTIAGNESLQGGGGFAGSGGQVTLVNTIVAGNKALTGADCQDDDLTLVSQGYNLIGQSADCSFTPATGDQFDVEAQLGPLLTINEGLRYRPLLSTSPAIDAGDPAGCKDHQGHTLDADQRGALRNGRCDIGAYEYTLPGAASAVLVQAGNEQHAPPSWSFRQQLQAAVIDDAGSPVEGVQVTFSAPTGGASGVFAAGSPTTTVTTGENGLGSAAIFTANQVRGSYVLTATANGVVSPTHFHLANLNWFVSNSGDDANSCQSAAESCASIDAPLEKAGFAPGDVVMVASGTYTGMERGQVVLLDRDVFVSGGWTADFLTQPGHSTVDVWQYLSSGIRVQPLVTAEIERFHVQNATGSGLSNGGDVILWHSTISGNSGGYGGGGIANEGRMEVHHSRITGNQGGIENRRELLLINSTVDSNDGHGISMEQGSITLDGTAIKGNSGRGISNVSGHIVVFNSTISSNRGGISNGDGTVHLNNCTVSNNSIVYHDTDTGGIGNFGNGTITVNNCTVSGNWARRGGGIYMAPSVSGSVTVRNSILAGNRATESGDDYGGINRITFEAYNLVGGDPHLGSLQGFPGWLPLKIESSARDAGDPAGCTDYLGQVLATDQRGMPRLGRCDLGAFEMQALEGSDKTASERTVLPGGNLGYTISIRNISDSEISGVTLTDTLPISLTYVADSLQATSGDALYSSGLVTWRGNVSPSEPVMLTYETTLNEDTPLFQSLTNTAVISGDGALLSLDETVLVDGQICGFSKHESNPVLQPTNGTWDAGGVWQPFVLAEPGGYKMWYTGDDGSGPSEIGLATSSDGINWTKHAGNPVITPEQSWEINGVSTGSVLYEGGRYRMWYTGFDANGIAAFGYAESPDGITWTKEGGNPVLRDGGGWDNGGKYAPMVVRWGGRLHVWYTGYDGVGTYSVGHRTTFDGTSTADREAEPVFDTGAVGSWDWLNTYAPHVVEVAGELKMWYSGDTLPPAWQTGYATSAGGQDWSRGRMLIPVGDEGSFDDSRADHVSVLAGGSGYDVWYSGHNGQHYSIGYGNVTLCAPAWTEAEHLSYLPLISKPAVGPQYSDNFSDPGSGWPVFSDATVQVGYSGNQYQIWLKDPGSGMSVTAGAKAKDFLVEVNARRTSGQYDAYGLVFDLDDDWSEYFAFLISGEYFSFWMVNNGHWQPWEGREWEYSEYIRGDTAWNQLAVKVDGDQATMYANGQQLATASHAPFAGFRRIGLTAQPAGDASVEVLFDDFAIYDAE